MLRTQSHQLVDQIMVLAIIMQKTSKYSDTHRRLIILLHAESL